MTQGIFDNGLAGRRRLTPLRCVPADTHGCFRKGRAPAAAGVPCHCSGDPIRVGKATHGCRRTAADAPACGDVIDTLAKQLGGVDVFVNNAGTGDNSLLLEMTWQQWRHTVATDLDGAFIAIQRAARWMVEAGNGGRVIAITSVHEHQPRVGSSAYDAAKHGLGGLIKTVALELGQYAITANSVAPGEIATPMTGQTDQDPHEVDRPGVPLGRPGDAREIAAVVAFLASPASSYVTGASWVVDGGMLQMGPQAGSHLTSNNWRTS